MRLWDEGNEQLISNKCFAEEEEEKEEAWNSQPVGPTLDFKFLQQVSCPLVATPHPPPPVCPSFSETPADNLIHSDWSQTSAFTFTL